jgi:hypothetical protein
VAATTLRDLDALYADLDHKLNERADELSPSQYIEARRYLNQVKGAIDTLKSPRAVNFFNTTWNARGKTVAELVDNLRREGLRFAPATQGDESAYNSLYDALRSFDCGLQSDSK